MKEPQEFTRIPPPPPVNKTRVMLKTLCFGKGVEIHNSEPKGESKKKYVQRSQDSRALFSWAKTCDRSRSNSKAIQPNAYWVSAKQADAAILKISSTAEYLHDLAAIKMKSGNWGMEQQRDYYGFLFSVQSTLQWLLRDGGTEDTGPAQFGDHLDMYWLSEMIVWMPCSFEQ